MKNLNPVFFLSTLLVLFSFSANAQLKIESAGDWGTVEIWTQNKIADDITEDVLFHKSTGTVTVSKDYTIGNVELSDKNNWIINAASSFELGEISTPKNLNIYNNAALNVDGDLVIWGDLTAKNNLELNVTGNLIIKGNVDFKNNAILNITGSMNVDGNFTTKNNLEIEVDGKANIGGDFKTGNNATASGFGSVKISGTCSSGICNTGPLAIQLPIELYAYDVTLKDNRVRIDWTTASESNNDYFIVERSQDAFHFEEIGSEEGAGTSDALRYYTITDKFPLADISYYRLKQIDFDGTTTYFDVKIVDNKDGFANEYNLTVFPNPVLKNNNFSIGLKGFEGNNIQVKIQNMSGFLIYSDELNISQEREFLELDTNILKDSGMYVLSVFSNNRWYHHKFMMIE